MRLLRSLAPTSCFTSVSLYLKRNYALTAFLVQAVKRARVLARGTIS